jgi:hypothetical protein
LGEALPADQGRMAVMKSLAQAISRSCTVASQEVAAQKYIQLVSGMLSA